MDSDNKFLAIAGLFVGAGLIATKISSRKEKIAEAERLAEEEKRRTTPFEFPDNISKNEFEEIVQAATKKIKRVTQVVVDEFNITCKVISQSGISDWNFTIDFNDYGHLTGKYWISSGNLDSQIPSIVAERIAQEIKLRIGSL